ncbi:MAG: hypothetical protein F6K55_36995 [Moorea sp. SIO4A3]|nr:hypothetical protein [Moorena sp. SIO4A3]
MRLAYGHATLRKRFGKADATRTQSVAKGLSFRAYAISPTEIATFSTLLLNQDQLS